MILISTESGKTVDFPSSWDELKRRRGRHLWSLQARCLCSGASPMEFSVRVLLYLLGLRRLPNRDGKPSENIYLLCEQCLGFLFSADGATLSFRSTVNPMPRIGLRRGPGDMLRNLTFGEFRHASAAMRAYAESHDAADLDECIAILYRTPWKKANRAGRRAAALGGVMFKLDLALARATASWRKSLAFAWFCSTLQYLQRGKLIINGELVDLALLFSPSGGSRGPDCSLNDLLVQFARDGVLGNVDRVDEEPLLSIFSIMWSNFKEAKRYETTLKAKKSK